MSTVPILMLGSDFQYAFAPRMGADSLNATEPAAGMQWKVDPVTGKKLTDASGNYISEPAGTLSTGESASTVWNEIKGFIPNLIDAGKDTVIAAIKAKHPGMSDSDANKVAAAGGFNIQSYMPMIIIGGVALVALLFMAGTRKRA